MIKKTCFVVTFMVLIQLNSIYEVYASQPKELKKKVMIPVSEVMEYLGFETSQEEFLRTGEILSKSMPGREKTPKELAIASVMIIIHRPLDVVAETFLSGESFRVHNSVIKFHEISDQDQATGPTDNFNGIRFSNQEKSEEEKLFKSRPGNTFNLSEDEIDFFKNVEKDELDSSDSIAKILREILHNRYKRYLNEGLPGIDPYAREKERLIFPGKELKSAIDSMDIAKKYLPEFHRNVLEFPVTNYDKISSKFYWLKLSMQNRPNFVLTHQLADISDEYAIVVEKIYYSLHTVDSSLIVIGCLPYDGGTVVFYMNHLFTDQVLGFAQKIKRAEGKKAIAKSVSEYFGRLRDMLGVKKRINKK
jgi:hypothetical protein